MVRAATVVITVFLSGKSLTTKYTNNNCITDTAKSSDIIPKFIVKVSLILFQTLTA